MRVPPLILLVLFFVGCSASTKPWNGKLSDKFPEPVRIALEQAPEFELFSLDPKHRDESAPTQFYRRRVVGKTTIKDAGTRNRLLGALDASVRAEKKVAGAACFDPRHAIRVQHSGKTFYIVICFHCDNVYIYTDDDPEHQDYLQIDMSPLPVFDEVLKAANVPLAKDGQLEDKLGKEPNRP